MQLRTSLSRQQSNSSFVKFRTILQFLETALLLVCGSSPRSWLHLYVVPGCCWWVRTMGPAETLPQTLSQNQTEELKIKTRGNVTRAKTLTILWQSQSYLLLWEKAGGNDREEHSLELTRLYVHPYTQTGLTFPFWWTRIVANETADTTAKNTWKWTFNRLFKI